MSILALKPTLVSGNVHGLTRAGDVDLVIAYFECDFVIRDNFKARQIIEKQDLS